MEKDSDYEKERDTAPAPVPPTKEKQKQKQKRITTFMDLPDERNEEREQRRKELGLDW